MASMGATLDIIYGRQEEKSGLRTNVSAWLVLVLIRVASALVTAEARDSGTMRCRREKLLHNDCTVKL